MKLDDILDTESERLDRLLNTGTGSLWTRLRRWRTALVVLPIAVAFLHWRGVPAQITKATLDAAIALQPHEQPKFVRLVSIDDRDYVDLFAGKSPLDVTLLSRLVAAIAKGQPKLIVVDIDTSDQSFRNLLVSPGSRIVWAAADEGRVKGKFIPVAPLGGRTLDFGWHTGLAEAPNDSSGVVHGYWRVFPTTEGPVPSIEFATALAFRGEQFSVKPFPDSENERTLDFRYVFYRTNARSVLNYAKGPGWEDGILRNRIVVLGGSYRLGRDRYATPVGLLDGSEIVAQAIEAGISQTDIPAAGPWLGLFEIIGGLIVIAVYQRFRLWIGLVASLLLLPLLSILGSYLVYHRFAPWLALMPALTIVLVSELYTKAAVYQGLYSKLKSLIEKRDAATPAPQTESAPGD